jgi:hypothetical protein
MHSQLSSELSTGGSPGKLAQYTKLIAEHGANIKAIGGAEVGGSGGVAVLLHEDLSGGGMNELIEKLTDEGFPSSEIFAAEAVVPDEVGGLAGATALLAELNILTILVVDSHGGNGLVTFGFGSQPEANEARQLLGDLAVPRHGLSHAWDEHEAWDANNPNQPPPDPHNPGR